MGLPAKDLGLSHHVISVDSILATLERHRTPRNLSEGAGE
jgi:hypothetical protein